jgi:beta-mannosidase
MAAGIIEDPFYRNNELDVQWVDKEDWEYKTTFSITRSQLSQSNLTLVFKGLDTYADVYVNDSLLLSADNMFRTWEVDVKPVAKKGTNELRILFHSPIKKGLELLNASPWPLPNDNDQSQRGGLGDQKVSVFTRKAPYHYGWDWGPRLVTSGVWRPVVIRTWDEVRINELFIKQPVVTKERADLVASVDIETNEVTDGSITIVNVADGLVFARKKIVLQPGKNKIDINFSIEKPKRWWSNGLGEPNM